MGPWAIIATFSDGSTYRSRSGFINGKPTMEERIFNADGSLRPLPNGRRSLADDENEKG